MCEGSKKTSSVGWVMMAVKDLDRAVALYSELLGIQFTDVSEIDEPNGVRVAINLDDGILLFQQLPGRRDTEYARFVEDHGEGIMGVAILVDDLDKARAKAEQMGIGIKHSVQLNDEQITRYHNGVYRTFKEIELNSATTFGARLFVAQVDLK